MAVSVSTIRQRIQTAIDAVAGMKPARNPIAGFERGPNTVAHLSYAVGITAVEARPDDRQRQSQGTLTETKIDVVFAYRLKPKAQLTSYDEAFDKAESLMQTITNRTPTVYNEVQIRFLRLSNELSSAGEFIIITLSFEALHYMPL